MWCCWNPDLWPLTLPCICSAYDLDLNLLSPFERLSLKKQTTASWRFLAWKICCFLLSEQYRTMRCSVPVLTFTLPAFFDFFIQRNKICSFSAAVKIFLLFSPFITPDSEFMSCESVCVWKAWTEYRAPVLWLTLHFVSFYLFKLSV